MSVRGRKAVHPRLMRPRAGSAGIQHRRTPPSNASVLSRVLNNNSIEKSMSTAVRRKHVYCGMHYDLHWFRMKSNTHLRGAKA